MKFIIVAAAFVLRIGLIVYVHKGTAADVVHFRNVGRRESCFVVKIATMVYV
jgi:hypothetical protein